MKRQTPSELVSVTEAAKLAPVLRDQTLSRSGGQRTGIDRGWATRDGHHVTEHGPGPYREFSQFLAHLPLRHCCVIGFTSPDRASTASFGEPGEGR